MGYSAQEIAGKHHRLFCDPEYAKSPAYQQLWQALGRGEAISGTFERVDKAGREVWLQASYMPVLDEQQRVTSVIKVASDITQRIHDEHESEALLQAIGEVPREAFVPADRRDLAYADLVHPIGRGRANGAQAGRQVVDSGDKWSKVGD